MLFCATYAHIERSQSHTNTSRWRARDTLTHIHTNTYIYIHTHMDTKWHAHTMRLTRKHGWKKKKRKKENELMSGTLCTVKLRLLRVFFPFSISKIIFFFSLSVFFYSLLLLLVLCVLARVSYPIISLLPKHTQMWESIQFNSLFTSLHFEYKISNEELFFARIFHFFFLSSFVCVSVVER